MSATNRGAERAPNDFYATPFWCVDRLLEWYLANVSPRFDANWLEPCAGTGAIVKAAQNFNACANIWWHLNEIDEAILRRGGYVPNKCDVTVGDFRKYLAPCRFDVIISNPPYSIAEDIIEHAISLRPMYGVFMLLRLNFLESAKRASLLQTHTPSILVLPNRPQFAVNRNGKVGTDATGYAWFLWKTQPSQPFVHILNLTSNKDLDKHREMLLRVANTPII